MANRKSLFSLILVVYSFVLISFVVDAFIHPVGKEEYEVLVKLATGNFYKNMMNKRVTLKMSSSDFIRLI